MSGIFGFWQPFAEVNKYKDELNKLALWNKAYGNDSEEIHFGEDFCLGCNYEKFSEKAKRSTPVLKKDEKYAVIDALLYNREELTKKGDFTQELSDEELIFSYIDKFGFGGLKDINGDFCGAIYDSRSGVMTLFRDQLGVRPLFYYTDKQKVVFSSDIRGIVSMQSVDVSVDEKWLWQSVVGNATLGAENTEFAHIFCVKPASYVTIHREENLMQLSKMSYWELGKEKIRLSSEKAYIERMRELITDAVKRRLDAVSGLVGAELSGGLDSGVIDILIHRLGRECVHFSWSASPEEIPIAKVDERRIIEDICKQEGITCNYGKRKFPLDETSVIAGKMRDIGLEVNMEEGYMERFVLPPYINTLQVSETSQFISRNGAKVIFTGHGGDEGVSHRCNAYEMFYHKEYLSYLKYFWSSTKGEKRRIYKTISRVYRNLTNTGRELKKPFVTVYAVEELLKKEFLEKYSGEKRTSLTFAYDATEYVKCGGSRNRLDVVALLGAYSGARYVIPYLDYRVIDYAVSIPRHLYLKNKVYRYIFREAFKDLMPESLYVLDDKRSNSWSNVSSKSNEPKDPQKEEERHIEKKKFLAEKLDRKYWEQYLDFTMIDRWVTQGKQESDAVRDEGMIMHISNCIKFQNLVERSRAVGFAESES